MGRTINNSLQSDPIKTVKVGDMRWRELRMEVIVDGKYSEKEKERKSHPGTPSDSLYYHEKNPKSKESQSQEKPSSRWEGEVKVA